MNNHLLFIVIDYHADNKKSTMKSTSKVMDSVSILKLEARLQ